MKIPKQLFVTSKLDSIGWDTVTNTRVEELLGFLHPYDDTKAFEKRKKTQMDWAYGSYVWSQWYEKDGEYWCKGKEVTFGPNRERQEREIDEIIPETISPKIWDNVPLSGFKILRSVSRYSTSNKLWRILDPRGVVFEISTGSLEDILLKGSVVNGVIQGECIWASNKNLVLANSLR